MTLNRCQFLFIYINILLLLSKGIALDMKKSYEVSQVAVINEPGDLIVPTLRMVGRSRALNGTLTFHENLYDDIKTSIKIYSDSNRNGEYTEMPIQLPELGACQTIEKYYSQFLKNTLITGVHTNFNLMNGTVCPLPKGTYWINNVLFNSEDWINVLPYGNIKLQLSYMENGENMGGVSIIVNIARKLFM